MEQIQASKIGDFLKNDFIKPLNVSTKQMAKDIHIPVKQIDDILANKRLIDADMSIRLSYYFNTPYDYFLKAQSNILIRETLKKNKAKYEKIKPIR